MNSVDLGGASEDQDSTEQSSSTPRSSSTKALKSANSPLRQLMSPLRYSSTPFDYPLNKRETRSQPLLNTSLFEPLADSTPFGNNKMDAFRKWIYCISIVNFDLNVGQVLEYTYPQTDFGPDEVKKMYVFSWLMTLYRHSFSFSIFYLHSFSFLGVSRFHFLLSRFEYWSWRLHTWSSVILGLIWMH